MMKWSLMVGKIWGTELRLHASLLLLIPYVLIVFKPEDIGGALRMLLLITGIFVCVALHEYGHTLAARMFGIEVTSIVLWPLGGFANLSRRPEKVLEDLVISAAGPLTNMVLFVYLALVTIAEGLFETSNILPGLSTFLWQTHVFSFLIGMSLANLSLAVFNLIPIYPLDGGQIARGMLKLIFGEKNANLLMLLISLPLSLGLTIFGLVTRDVIMVLTGLLLSLAGITLNFNLFNKLLLGMLFFTDRGGYYLRRQDYDNAITEYTRVIERKPNLAGPYISRAVAQLNLLEYERASADTQHALALDPNNPLIWTLHGELLSIKKDHSAALESFNQAIKLKPDWGPVYLDRAGVAIDVGDLTSAVEDMNRGVEWGRGSALGYVLRSMLRHQMGDLTGSRSDTEQALRFAPDWMLVFPEVIVLNLIDHLKWALDYYAQAIECMPNAYQAFQGRADACRVNQRPDWAIADYGRAIQLSPANAVLYLNRGRAYLAAGSPTHAVDDFRQAAVLSKVSHIRRQAEAMLRQPATPHEPARQVIQPEN